MELREALRRFERPGVRHWVWVSGPEFMFEEDGTPRRVLEPSADSRHYDADTGGWWTCDPATKAGDLVLMYRSGGKDKSLVGPKDVAYLVLAMTDARPLRDDPSASGTGFEGFYGCGYAVLVRFERPIVIAEMRANPVIATWPALRASFVRASWEIPGPVWDELMSLVRREQPDVPGSVAEEVSEALRREYQERELEDRLVARLDLLGPHGYDLDLIDRQYHAPGHGGFIDVFCTRKDDSSAYVVIELKVVEAGRDAAGQLLGYMGWVRRHCSPTRTDGLLIAPARDSQLTYALQEIGERVERLRPRDIAGL